MAPQPRVPCTCAAALYARQPRKGRPLTVHHLDQLLLVCSLVLLVAVAAVRISSRSGLPSLLVYLGIGVAMGQDGVGDIHFDNTELTQVIGYAALVVILAEGGLGTKWKRSGRSCRRPPPWHWRGWR